MCGQHNHRLTCELSSRKLGQLVHGQHELQGHLLHGQHEHWVKLLHGTLVQGRVKVVSDQIYSIDLNHLLLTLATSSKLRLRSVTAKIKAILGRTSELDRASAMC